MRVEQDERVLVTTLTKKMAEDLTEYLSERDVRVEYLHSDVDTLRRVELLRELRMGRFDVLVGINLLREGLDLPEVSLVSILDADKEGFLRSGTSLIQTIGRAARNVSGEVHMYADTVTDSMAAAIDETNRRRAEASRVQQRARHRPHAVAQADQRHHRDAGAGRGRHGRDAARGRARAKEVRAASAAAFERAGGPPQELDGADRGVCRRKCAGRRRTCSSSWQRGFGTRSRELKKELRQMMAGGLASPFPRMTRVTSAAVWALTLVGVVARDRRSISPWWSGSRTSRPSASRCGGRSSTCVSPCVFGVSMLWWRAPGQDGADEFFAGYLTEWSLSVDNLFVFLVILGRFAVPAAVPAACAAVRRRPRAGAAGPVHRGGRRGAVRVLVGVLPLRRLPAVDRLLRGSRGRGRRGRRRVPGEQADADREAPGSRDGRLPRRRRDRARGRAALITPLLLVMVAIGSTDVLFALDSIPAIFGLTKDPYLVFTANAFALMGLRQLFFVVEGLLKRLKYLSYGLSTVLAFIAVKLILEALHEQLVALHQWGQRRGVGSRDAHVAVPRGDCGRDRRCGRGVSVLATGGSGAGIASEQPD